MKPVKKPINVELKKVTAVIDAGETLLIDEQSIFNNLFIEPYGSKYRICYQGNQRGFR